MYPRGGCFSGGLQIYPGVSLIRCVTLWLSICVFNIKVPEINPGMYFLSSVIPYNPDPENERGLTVLLAWRGGYLFSFRGHLRYLVYWCGSIQVMGWGCGEKQGARFLFCCCSGGGSGGGPVWIFPAGDLLFFNLNPVYPVYWEGKKATNGELFFLYILIIKLLKLYPP